MPEIVPYSDKYLQVWTEFVEKSPDSSIAHEIGWRRVIRDGLGHRPAYIMALESDRVTGVLPLFVVRTWWGKRYVVSQPWMDYGGMCAENRQTAEALLAEAKAITRKEKAEFLEFRSVKDDDLDLALRKDKVTFLLELDSDPDVIWKGFNAKLRNQIRKSDKVGLTTEFTGVDGLDEFYRVFSYNMRDLGTPVWGRGFFERILTEFPNSASLIIVRHEDKVVAGGLVLSSKDHLYVPSASAYRSALKLCPNQALYWAVIKSGCERGFKFFDFGRSSWDSNTFKFKKQWTPDPVQLTWQYYLNRTDEVPAINPDNSKYKLMISMWQKLPLPVANILGPRVIRNFP